MINILLQKMTKRELFHEKIWDGRESFLPGATDWIMGENSAEWSSRQSLPAFKAF
jgi:hypothetical protein